jgi:ribonuclease P protein component
VTDFGFTGRLKLKKTDEFSSVFNFRKRISGMAMVVHYMPNALGYPRLGMVVGKKTVRLAVRRNYMKRVLRELFRQGRHALGGVDILVRPYKEFTHQQYAEISEEFLQLLGKLRT